LSWRARKPQQKEGHGCSGGIPSGGKTGKSERLFSYQKNGFLERKVEGKKYTSLYLDKGGGGAQEERRCSTLGSRVKRDNYSWVVTEKGGGDGSRKNPCID